MVFTLGIACSQSPGTSATRGAMPVTLQGRLVEGLPVRNLQAPPTSKCDLQLHFSRCGDPESRRQFRPAKRDPQAWDRHWPARSQRRECCVRSPWQTLNGHNMSVEQHKAARQKLGLGLLGGRPMVRSISVARAVRSSRVRRWRQMAEGQGAVFASPIRVRCHIGGYSSSSETPTSMSGHPAVVIGWWLTRPRFLPGGTTVGDSHLSAFAFSSLACLARVDDD
jgi:hypothetical protein